MNLYTFTDAAARIGCHKSQISRRAKRLGIGRRLGSVKVLTTAQVQKLAGMIAVGHSGNPNSRNALGQFRKS